jgi:hypothetical protein
MQYVSVHPCRVALPQYCGLIVPSMDIQTPADALTPADEAALAEDTAAIQRSYNNIRAEAVGIGERLAKWNETLSHGKWLCWVETELPFSAQTARNLIHLAAFAKTKPVLDLPIDLSGLYILAAPSTPPAAVDEVIEIAKTAKVTKNAVKAIVAKHKTTAPPPEPTISEPVEAATVEAEPKTAAPASEAAAPSKAKSAGKRASSSSSSSMQPKRLTTPEFRQQLEAVVKRLQARAANPGEDFVEGVRNCAAQLAALLAQWVST